MTVTAWRYWGLLGDGTLTSPHGWAAAWQPGVNTATCQAADPGTASTMTNQLAATRHEPHQPYVPDPDCSCGWRAMPALEDLLAWWQPLAAACKPLFPWTRAPLALDVYGQVVLSGRTCGPDPRADPPGVIRGEHAQITGTLYITRRRAPLAAALASRYGTDVGIADGDGDGGRAGGG